MIINLTPHPIHVYHPNTPDRIEPDGEHEPLYVLEPSGELARLGLEEVDHDAVQFETRWVPVAEIDYRGAVGLPEPTVDPAFYPSVYYVVSLVVALAARGRLDLLSPYREVRNMSGQVIGCRAFARPV